MRAVGSYTFTSGLIDVFGATRV